MTDINSTPTPPDETGPLWDRYRDILKHWRTRQRRRVVDDYRLARQREQPRQDDPPTMPIAPAPPPHPTAPRPIVITPVSLPKEPVPPRTGGIILTGVGAGGAAALLFGAMMAAGWQHSPGAHIIPALLLFDAIVATIVGSMAMLIALGLERNRHHGERDRYERANNILTQQMWTQDAQWDAARAQSNSTAAAQMQFEQQHANWQQHVAEVERERQRLEDRAQTITGLDSATTHDIADETILAMWDESEADDLDTMLAMAQTDGTAPKNTPAWLGATAKQIKLTSDLIGSMIESGWDIRSVETFPHRSLVVVSGPSIPAETTVMFHHATPEQITDNETHIVSYDDESLAYRPAPGTDHSLPEGYPARSVHTYTQWKIKGINETPGYGLLGTDTFLATPDTLLQAINTAEA